jgi:glycosyltransferase involved in cell wall biosynthesis
MRSLKILMIAPQPCFEARGTPLSVLGRLQALSHLGHEVDLLTYPIGQNVTIPGVTIHRTASLPFITEVPVGPSLRKLLLDGFLFARAVRLLLHKQYDLLHTHEEASVFGALLARRFKVRHVYDMHSSLPEQLTAFGFARRGVVVRAFEWLERWAVRRSDAVIVICPALGQHLGEIDAGARWVTIENILGDTCPEGAVDGDAERLRAQWSLDGHHVVLYTGTLEAYQGIDLLIDAATHVVSMRQDVVFVLVGGTSDQIERCEKRVGDLRVSHHFRFTGIQPLRETPRFVNLADLLVSPRTQGHNTPSKIYSYLKSGKPIVATNVEAHKQVLTPRVAFLVAPAPRALAHGILAALADRSLAMSTAVAARQWYDERYSLEAFVRDTEQVLRMALR